MLTMYLVHLDCDIESDTHEEMSTVSSSSTQTPKGSAGRNKLLGVQDIELQWWKRNTADLKGLESRLSDRKRFELSTLSLSPSKAAGWYGRHQRRNVASIMEDSKPATLIKNEDRLRTQEAAQSSRNIFEVVAVEQDEWAQIKDHSRRLGLVPDPNTAGSKPRE